VAGQQRLQLGGCHLVGADLDELLEPVDHEHVAAGVDLAEVAGVQPAAGVDHLDGGVGAAQVAGHHLRAPRPQLTRLAGAEVASSPRVDHPQLGVGHHPPDRAGHGPGVAVRRGHPDAGLGQPPALAHGRAGDAGGHRPLQLGAERGATGHDQLHR
jgi:hypothetical protein